MKNLRPQLPEIKLMVGETLKNKGNACFERKDFIAAGDFYLNSIAIFRSYVADPESLRFENEMSYESEAQQEEVSRLINILFLNLSQCYLEEKLFENAFMAADQAMRIDFRNPKAYYRQAKALAGIDNLESLKKSLECIQTGVQYCTTSADRLTFAQLSKEITVRADHHLNTRIKGSLPNSKTTAAASSSDYRSSFPDSSKVPSSAAVSRPEARGRKQRH